MIEPWLGGAYELDSTLDFISYLGCLETTFVLATEIISLLEEEGEAARFRAAFELLTDLVSSMDEPPAVLDPYSGMKVLFK